VTVHGRYIFMLNSRKLHISYEKTVGEWQRRMTGNNTLTD